eukprot:TRINITY_DN49230_c0_g1_i1.p1 TRINITY_DN49230_c0_g1~~TRINITY_DN49230_c0_g1_i1.p1  ORF type:complete len:211 (+),score=22.54 TRINITY_DN49230_c0_g1_i1:73-705(+)
MGCGASLKLTKVLPQKGVKHEFHVKSKGSLWISDWIVHDHTGKPVILLNPSENLQYSGGVLKVLGGASKEPLYSFNVSYHTIVQDGEEQGYQSQGGDTLLNFTAKRAVSSDGGAQFCVEADFSGGVHGHEEMVENTIIDVDGGSVPTGGCTSVWSEKFIILTARKWEVRVGDVTCSPIQSDDGSFCLPELGLIATYKSGFFVRHVQHQDC